jgi:nicotinamidase-related amidase
MKNKDGIIEAVDELPSVGVVLIDVQESLLNNIAKKDELLSSLNILIKAIKSFGLPLIVTEQVPEKLGPTVDYLSRLIPSVNPIKKNSFSVFGSEEFHINLNEQRLSHLVFVGIETSICIYLSAVDALKSGLEVTILYDCVGARRSKEDESVVLEKLEKAGCHILPLESFLYGYMGTAEHPSFRQISKLVRER